MLSRVTDRVRARVFEALSSKLGEEYKPLRMAREVLATANDLAGRPFCPEAELAERRAARAGAAPLTAPSAPPTFVGAPSRAAEAREAAPVMLYFDGKDHRTKKKIEELLKARGIPFRTLDVTDDESTRSWAQTTSKLEEFPLVFIAGEPVGGLHELTHLDVNGGLLKKVFGR